MLIDKKTFEGGMDFDSDPRAVAPGDYRKAFCVRIGTVEGQNAFAVENIKGNALVSYVLPAGTNKVIGNYDDKQNSKVYYFVFNSLTQHSVLEYNYATGAITKVLQDPVLAFASGFLITHINVLEGQLSWTDNLSRPREIDIAQAKLFSQGNASSAYPPGLFTDEYLSAIRFAPPCEPTAGYADDTSRTINYLDQKLFQFKYRWVYFNSQKSTWSAISKIPLPGVVCGNTSLNPSKNNNIQVTVRTGSGIVKRIEIAARKGNTGDFFEITTLDKTKLSIASNTTYVYAFYNEKIYSDIDIKESILPFDYLPLKAGTQELVENRKTYGDITEGQDPVDVEAKLTLSYQQDISTTTYSLTGRIYIKSPFAQDDHYSFNQPIHNFGGGYVWGGFATQIVGYDNSVGSAFFQNMPLGGWPVYLAGTPYYGVSRQAPPSSTNPPAADTNGVFDSSTASARNKIRNEIQNRSCYSVFTISGVPPGTYVLRIGDHNTTQSELDDPGLGYQKRSTNTVQVAGIDDCEVKITITQAGQVLVNSVPVSVSNNVASLGETHIFDLTNPGITGSTALTGYLTDQDIQPTPTTYAALLGDTRIELATVFYNGVNGTWNARKNDYVMTKDWDSPNISYTDHNGYFFIAGNSLLSGNVNVNIVRFGGMSAPPNEYNTSGGGFGGVTGNQGAQIVARIPTMAPPNAQLSVNARTTLSGKVFDDNGNPVEGVNVVIAHGRAVKTDITGTWNLKVYGNEKPATVWIPNNSVRQDQVLFSLSDNCIGAFATSPDTVSIAIDSTAVPQTNFTPSYYGHYNDINGCELINQTVNIIGGGAATKALKRGGAYLFGIVYYNDANQSGLTNTREEPFTRQVTTNGYGLKLEIPFYTEGQPIVGQSSPIVQWDIFHRPPSWATHYQWVRTRNTATNNYLQFICNTVQGVDDNRNAVSFVTATKLSLDIRNITAYNTSFTDTKGNVTYDFTRGDRVRFIRESGGNFYQQYADFPIRDWDTTGIIYIDYVAAIGQPQAGTLIEIYTPKLDTKEQLTWEWGECYEVGDPGLSTRYHKGPVQDQSGTNLSGVPAKGTFSGGDTYYRARTMPYVNSSNQTSYALRVIEDRGFSDFFPSKVEDIGRPNRIDADYKQVRRPTTIYHSEIFIPETFVNGLNRFFDTSFETYDRQFGSIQRLFADNHVLEVYQVKKCGEIPINRRYLYNAGGDNQLVTTDSFFNEMTYHTGDWGIYYNPESFCSYGNSRYFVDIARGAVLRKNIDGLTPISEYKMHTYFTGKSETYIANNLFPKIYGAYDRKFDEYILCFETVTQQGSDVVNPLTIAAETVVFSEKRNKWTVFQPFDPENIGTAGLEIISFRGGVLWRHNKNSVYNNFYGTQYKSEVWPVINADPSKEKVFQTISLESTHPWEMYDATTPSGQSTKLIEANFQLLEDVYYSDIFRNQNTPNIANALFDGDNMRGSTMTVKLRNAQTTLVTLFAVNVGLIASERSNK